MKLAFFNDYQLGVIKDSRIIDASPALEGISYYSPQELMKMVITGWGEIQPKIEQAVAGKKGIALDKVRLRPPLPRPGQLVCLAGNYIEASRPDRGEFNGFLKSPTGVVGKGDTVELPPVDASVFHFEPELSLIIGKDYGCINISQVVYLPRDRN